MPPGDGLQAMSRAAIDTDRRCHCDAVAAVTTASPLHGPPLAECAQPRGVCSFASALLLSAARSVGPVVLYGRPSAAGELWRAVAARHPAPQACAAASSTRGAAWRPLLRRAAARESDAADAALVVHARTNAGSVNRGPTKPTRCASHRTRPTRWPSRRCARATAVASA